MSGIVRVVQCAFGRQSASLELNLNETLVLINSPEMLHRACVETKTRLSKVVALLFTQVNAGTLLGYPDLLMTIADLG